MTPSPPNPAAAAAAAAAAATKSLMAMKMKGIKYLHLFAEGALSFFAFLLSIFIYFSVFNLSLSTDLLNHTKFWFCISNTLIFIIAADCGAFSPPPASFHACRGINSAAKIPNQLNPNRRHNSNARIVLSEPPTSAKPTQIPHTTTEVVIPLKFHDRRKSYQRSKSDNEMNQAKERTITIRKSKTMTRHEAVVSTKKEGEKKNEFAEMTDEELNRRVEKFIERFNRKIRLQDQIGHGDE